MVFRMSVTAGCDMSMSRTNSLHGSLVSGDIMNTTRRPNYATHTHTHLTLSNDIIISLLVTQTYRTDVAA